LKPVIFIYSILMLLAISAPDLKAQYLPLQADLDTLSNISQIDLSAESIHSVQFTDPVVFNDPDVIMGSISSVTVDSGGYVYVADNDQLTIHRFREDGSFIESFGRDGEGPGEFRSLIKLRYRDGKVFALDRNQNRITAFSTDSLKDLETISLSAEFQSAGSNLRSMPEDFFVLPGNRFLLAFSLVAGDSEQLYFQPVDIFDPNSGYEGENEIKIPVRQSVIFQNAGAMGFLYPVYGRRSTLYVSRGDSIYSNWSENILFKSYNTRGEYSGAWYDQIEKQPLRRRQLRVHYSDFYMDILSDEPLPDTWPAIRGFLVDDKHRFWVELVTDDMTVSEWVIVSEAHGLLGKFSMSAEDTIHVVQNNLIYMTNVNPDGLEIVKMYRLLLN